MAGMTSQTDLSRQCRGTVSATADYCQLRPSDIDYVHAGIGCVVFLSPDNPTILLFMHVQRTFVINLIN